MSLATIGKHSSGFCVNAKLKVFMQKANLLGNIQSPVEEIEHKLDEYFAVNGFKERGAFGIDGLSGEDEDYGYCIDGTMDDIQVSVVYYNYKPRKKVVREIMALDERISEVKVYRHLRSAQFNDKLWELAFEQPIFVMVDGELMKTTMYEFVHYSARNIDYTRCNR